jgi:hypothetical protein
VESTLRDMDGRAERSLIIHRGRHTLSFKVETSCSELSNAVTKEATEERPCNTFPLMGVCLMEGGESALPAYDREDAG